MHLSLFLSAAVKPPKAQHQLIVVTVINSITEVSSAALAADWPPSSIAFLHTLAVFALSFMSCLFQMARYQQRKLISLTSYFGEMCPISAWRFCVLTNSSWLNWLEVSTKTSAGWHLPWTRLQPHVHCRPLTAIRSCCSAHCSYQRIPMFSEPSTQSLLIIDTNLVQHPSCERSSSESSSLRNQQSGCSHRSGCISLTMLPSSQCPLQLWICSQKGKM